MNIFGFEIKKKSDKQDKNETVIVPSVDDGSTLVSSAGAGYYGYTLDIDGAVKNEDELIVRYREASFYPDCDSAIEDIINESISTDEDDKSVDVKLDDVEVSDQIKKKITEEFENIMELLDFDRKGHDIFRQWYIDGRLYYHPIVDKNKLKEGIQKLVYIDARKIRKIKNIQKKKNKNGVDIVVKNDEYYIYNPKGITAGTATGTKMSIDSVVYVPSGYIDNNNGMALSYLHKAIKPVNQLKMIEDAFVIYTISRAPQRRIFYIDVGNMPKIKAEQYVTDIMAKFRNKIVYDANTGEVKDTKKHMSILEDFWMPRREGGKGTEITTLQGGDTLIGNESMQYFQQKLFQSLNVPVGRLQPNQGFNLGKSSEITRDELKFNKFIIKLRKKFSNLFYSLLRIQLILKGIITDEEWEKFKNEIKFDFKKDNFFTEFKQNEIISSRIQLLQQADAYVGKYYSIEWARKNILMQTDDEVKELDKEIEAERKLGLYPPDPSEIEAQQAEIETQAASDQADIKTQHMQDKADAHMKKLKEK